MILRTRVCLYVHTLVCSGDSVSVLETKILEMVPQFSGFAVVILSWMHVLFCGFVVADTVYRGFLGGLSILSCCLHNALLNNTF